MATRYFPIGIQTFEKIRKLNAIYVDKTAYVHQLATRGTYFFLARPRRFGKSLLLSTFAAYFRGQKELFEGLAIDDLETEWIKHPVLHIDFSRKRVNCPKDLDILLDSLLNTHEEVYGAKTSDDPAVRLHDLIRRAYHQTQTPVVILVDEYDTPLLDTQATPELQDFVRQKLRDFYSPIKESDPYLRFVFLTGITKFSQLGIFSELNNISTLSMNDDYAAICGITQEELETQLRPEIEAFAQKQGLTFEKTIAQLKYMYDGYHFSKNSPDIYNPFSLLKCLMENDLSPFWFSTGTPTHVTEILSKYMPNPENLEGFSSTIIDFDVPLEHATTPIPILYQSGYLTIKKHVRGNYKLGFPNQEVRVSFLRGLMPYYTRVPNHENNTFMHNLLQALMDRETEKAMQLLRSFFSSIPYNCEKQDEAHYKTIFYLIFRLASEYTVRTEECTAAGRCDAMIETDDTIFLFEFKLEGTAEAALAQIDDKGYSIAYEAGNKKVIKIGANFDNTRRTIKDWVIA